MIRSCPRAGNAWITVGFAAGAALCVACDVGFRRTFGIARSQLRLVTAAAALTTVPPGTELGATAPVGGLAAIVAAALALDGSGRLFPHVRGLP